MKTIVANPTTEVTVLACWFRDAAFSRAWVPDPTLFTTPANRALAAASATLPLGLRDHAGLLVALERAGDADVVGGAAGLTDYLERAPLCGDPWPHVRRLEELASLRHLLVKLDVAEQRARERQDLGGFVGDIAEALRRVADPYSAESETEATMLNLAYEAATTPSECAWRIGTGIDPLDEDVGELEPGSVAVLGAGTSWGKSNLLLMFASVALDRGVRPLLVSWEDPPALWRRRLLAMRAEGVPATALRTGLISEHEREILEAAVAEGRDVPLYLDARGLSVERAATEVRARCAADGVQLVLCDYLQKITTAQPVRDRRSEVTTVARVLSDTIKTAGAAGWLASQVRRREERQRPTMHDLKESGDVENAAEMVVMGYRGDGGRRLLTVDKAKDGIAGGTYAPTWDSMSCCFRPGGTRVLPEDDCA